MADARLQRLQTELISAQDGVFLRDGANDAPYSQQQRDRLLLRRQELENKVLDEGLQSSQLAAEMAEERERLDRLSHFDLRLPAQHVVWSVAASPGSTVSEGQTLLDLAACDHRFVVVELPGGEFEQIKAGAPAFVRRIGSDDWKQGQVRQVRGSAARADDRLLAAQVPKPDPNSITVEVGLPQDDAQTDRNNFCTQAIRASLLASAMAATLVLGGASPDDFDGSPVLSSTTSVLRLAVRPSWTGSRTLNEQAKRLSRMRFLTGT